MASLIWVAELDKAVPVEEYDEIIASLKADEQTLDELKVKADELGIKYMPNIGAVKLKAKIDEHLAN